MIFRWLLILLVGILLISCEHGGSTITKVTILDQDFHEMKVIEDSLELAEFNQQWSQKEVINSVGEDSPKYWNYKLDIVIKGKSDRWLYDSSGKTKILSVSTQKLYQLSDVSKFNLLIGIK